ncbi:MAG: hypothetical protein QXJ27_05365, partial [Thermoplasmata archaeon]
MTINAWKHSTSNSIFSIGVIFFLLSNPLINTLSSSECDLCGVPMKLEISNTIPLNQNLPDHSPICIDGDSDFTFENGVRGGNGTPENPWRIEYWHIFSQDSPGILIKNTSAAFVIRYVVIETTSAQKGILLDNVKKGRIEKCKVSFSYVGIYCVDAKNIDILETLVIGCKIGIFEVTEDTMI